MVFFFLNKMNFVKFLVVRCNVQCCLQFSKFVFFSKIYVFFVGTYYNIFIMICPLFVLRLFSFSSKVREFAINDITPYPIAIEFNETSEPTKIEKTDVFVKANVIPSAKFVTFPKATNYDVRAV